MLKIKLETYSNRTFTVEKRWAKKWLKENTDYTLKEFLAEYTWDDTEQLYYDAIGDKKVIWEEKTLSLYRTDFASEKEWEQVCDSLNIPYETDEEVLIIYTKVTI